jgi:hypothetical protein
MIASNASRSASGAGTQSSVKLDRMTGGKSRLPTSVAGFMDANSTGAHSVPKPTILSATVSSDMSAGSVNDLVSEIRVRTAWAGYLSPVNASLISKTGSMVFRAACSRIPT